MTLRVLVNNNTIGGTTAGAGNLISGNRGDGVLIDQLCSGNLVQGNTIGTDVSGTLALGNAANGVEIRADSPNNTVGGTEAGAGNLISANGQDGVLLSSFQSVGTSGNIVQGNLIGTDVTGTRALGNGRNGLELFGGTNNSTIGGTAASAGNVISGNKADGILLVGNPSGHRPFGNLFQGNLIGTDINGTAALGNEGDGVDIQGGGFNTIGGTAPGAGNVISANFGDGVFLTFSVAGIPAHQNVIQGNYIGTDFTGAVALGNRGNGVHIKGPFNANFGPIENRIGGTAPGAGNFISGNRADGILIEQSAQQTLVQGNYVGTDSTGTAALGNGGNGIEVSNGAALTTIGGTAAGAGNLISANGQNGVLLLGASANTLQGNRIGTDVTGTAALGNGRSGLLIAVGFLNTVGGTTAAARNLISGNRGDGVIIEQSSSQTLVQGNYVGTDSTGTAALGNGGYGIEVRSGAALTTIGGTAAGAGNLISGNGVDGVLLGGFIGTDVAGSLLEGNFIGTDVTGTVALGNGGNGVAVFSDNNTIGGAGAGARNLISGNGLDGVLIIFPARFGNRVEGNYIGSDITGTQALGNAAHGVEIRFFFGSNNTVGGTAAGAGNLISGNGQDGVRISRSSGNQVLGNKIGTTAAGTAALGNGGAGVFLDFAFDNRVGGQAAGAGNTIAFNTGAGVFVNSLSGNLISRNSIFSNEALGIRLNRANNANNSQPAPVLSSAVLSDGTTTVQGTLTAAPNRQYTIEFFANTDCDPSGFGQGKTFLGSLMVTTDNAGRASFTARLSGVVSGQFITATATDPVNNTSEFSNCLAVSG